MVGQSKIGQVKERFSQQARARIPFNPVDGVDITGANVERLKVGMETFGWKDYRFVTAEQARAIGWSIPDKASSVRITTRDPSNGSVAERILYNASNVQGMPSLGDMLAMSDEVFLKMRGDTVEAPQVEQQRGEEREADAEEPAGGEVEGDVVIGPARQPEKMVDAARAGDTQEVNDLFLEEPVGKLDEPASQPTAAVVADQPQVEQTAEPAVESDFAVMAPYWLDGLHNHEGIKLAEQVNRLISAEKLAKDKAAIATLLNSYPDNRRLGLDIVPRSQYLNDPERNANRGEPGQLLGGELIRDKEGAYRPKAGGLPVLQDKGLSLVLKNKSEQAYRGAMELAKSKGWTAIELKGKPKMLAQAWIEATMMGLEVVNYTPTEQDRDRLAQRMAVEAKMREAAAPRPAEQAPETVEVRPVVDAAGRQVMATVTSTVKRSGADPHQVAPPTDELAGGHAQAPSEESVVTRTVTRVEGVVRSDIIEGVTQTGALEQGGQTSLAVADSVVDHEVSEALDEANRELSAEVDLARGARLIAHGHAPYDHKPQNKASYYVTVEDERGQSLTVWGKDLERSLTEAGAVPGDTISLVEGKRVPVEVEVEEPSGSKGWKTAHRVTWTTEMLSRAAEVVQDETLAPAVDVASTGVFVGPIVRVEDGRIAQKAGRDPNKLVWHDVSTLQGKVPEVGEVAEIKYDRGLGHVKGPQRAHEIAR